MHKPIQLPEHLQDRNWTYVDVYKDEEEEFGPREPLHRRDIYTDNRGSLIEVNPDGTWAFLCQEDPLPKKQPVAMWATTPRHGVVGYMCKIDFDCELGGTRSVVHTNARDAICAGTCGVVEVEVIGRRVVIEDNHEIEMGDYLDDVVDEEKVNAYIAEVTKQLEAIDMEGLPQEALAALKSIHPPMPEGKEHLVYRDTPKMLAHIWEWMKEELAPFELELLTDARYTANDGVELGRGQFFVHPDGLKHLNEVAFPRDKGKLFPDDV